MIDITLNAVHIVALLFFINLYRVQAEASGGDKWNRLLHSCSSNKTVSSPNHQQFIPSYCSCSVELFSYRSSTALLQPIILLLQLLMCFTRSSNPSFRLLFLFSHSLPQRLERIFPLPTDLATDSPLLYFICDGVLSRTFSDS